jgi:hypothetical protein
MSHPLQAALRIDPRGLHTRAALDAAANAVQSAMDDAMAGGDHEQGMLTTLSALVRALRAPLDTEPAMSLADALAVITDVVIDRRVDAAVARLWLTTACDELGGVPGAMLGLEADRERVVDVARRTLGPAHQLNDLDARNTARVQTAADAVVRASVSEADTSALRCARPGATSPPISRAMARSSAAELPSS